MSTYATNKIREVNRIGAWHEKDGIAKRGEEIDRVISKPSAIKAAANQGLITEQRAVELSQFELCLDKSRMVSFFQKGRD